MARLVDVEGADSAQLQAREMIQRVEAALSDDQTDLTHLITEATRTRNTVVNTVLRAYSGLRDSRNGRALPTGSDFRAATNIGNATYTPKAALHKSRNCNRHTMPHTKGKKRLPFRHFPYIKLVPDGQT